MTISKNISLILLKTFQIKQAYNSFYFNILFSSLQNCTKIETTEKF